MIKSQWGCSVDIFVNIRPHKFVLVGQNKDRVIIPLNLFIVLRRFQHCTGHIKTGSWKGRGNQYIQFVRVLYCKLATNGKELPAFPLEAVLGTEPRPQRWEARVLPLCHRGPYNSPQSSTRRTQDKNSSANTNPCVNYNKGRRNRYCISMFVPHVGQRMARHSQSKTFFLESHGGQ